MKYMKIAGVVLAVIILALGAGGAWWYVNDKNTPSESSTNLTAADHSENKDDTSNDEATDAAVTITYSDAGFSASAETVRAGDTILVVNNSSEVLQFSSDPHPQHTDNSELNLPTLRPGEQETMVVDKPGKWGFHNHLNDDHFGSITVTN